MKNLRLLHTNDHQTEDFKSLVELTQSIVAECYSCVKNTSPDLTGFELFLCKVLDISFESCKNEFNDDDFVMIKKFVIENYGKYISKLLKS